MPQEKPALFKIFPPLAEKIDYINLETKPSPVHRLKNLDHKNLWIKRNDIISSVYGGNKVRRLEFILGEVVKENRSRVVTMGGIGTNHGLATAIFCKRLGIDCTLLLFCQPVTRYVRQNLLLFHKYGAEMIYDESILEMARNFYGDQRERYPEAYFLDAGGSSPLGALGAVNGALELAEQIEDGLMPEPNYIFYPTASNGGMAGLMLGLKFADLNSTVIGVRVGASHLETLELNTPNTVTKMMIEVYELLRGNSLSIPEIEMPTPIMFNDYCGEGYGYPTREGNAALELFRECENIVLEPVYTGKTCAAILDFIKDPSHTNDTILYWHTYNSVDLSEEAESVDYHDLKPDFHQCFEDDIEKGGDENYGK